MNINFELVLFYATLITAFITMIDYLFLAERRRKSGKTKLPVIIDYARSFFPVLLIVFLLRSFLYEPFRIPSGSLEPTLLTGDFILVNKFDYGIRLPVIHKKIFNYKDPKRGDIIVFRWPPNPSYDFIKRVIGVPGDKISYINKTLYVNGEKIPQSYYQETKATDGGTTWPVVEKTENLFGLEHHIYVDNAKMSRDFQNVVVPEGMYFVMGDNRDDSADSRVWGFVPDENILGKAKYVWLSWDKNNYDVRFNRIGKSIH